MKVNVKPRKSAQRDTEAAVRWFRWLPRLTYLPSSPQQKRTRSESSVKLIEVLSLQLLGYLTNFLSDSVQFGFGFIQNSFGILNALANRKIPEIKAGSMKGRHDANDKALFYIDQDSVFKK